MWLLAGALACESTLMSCAAHESTPAIDTPPAASGSAAPAPSKRRESKEPSTKDPSIIKPPIGYRRMALGGILPTPAGNAVVLMDEQGRRGLLLRAHGSDALSIALRVDPTHGERASAHSSLADVVRKFGGDVVSVRVDRLDDDAFQSTVTLAKGGEVVDIDAASTDALALALALGSAVPVFVAETLLTQAGVDVDRFDFRKVRDVLPQPGTLHPDAIEL
ncbi:MAG TPA: bifunctional nuclease domain-containing protein [Polyangiaceae bacterium]|nr:bifunctional nuclease domain-containing protein [Polyangiaceae bacterium]